MADGLLPFASELLREWSGDLEDATRLWLEEPAQRRAPAWGPARLLGELSEYIGEQDHDADDEDQLRGDRDALETLIDQHFRVEEGR